MEKSIDDPLMNKDQVALYLKTSPRNVDRLPIAKIYLGPRAPRWRRSGVEAYLAQLAEAAA